MAATLDKDLLANILLRLDLADHSRFSRVCKWWRLVAAENPGVNKPFSLVQFENPKLAISKILDSFFGATWGEARFVGSCECWLVCFLLYKGVFLLNIASATKIWLPDTTWDNAVWDSSHNGPFPDRRITPWAARKIVLSCPPSTPEKCIIVRLDSRFDLSFCRLGESAWTEIYKDPLFMRQLSDIIFFNNQLYCMDSDGHLMVFDSGFSQSPTVLNFPSFGSYTCLANAASDDKLLVIQINNGVYKVFEIDTRNLSYTEVESLGDKTLFVLRPFSLLSAKNHPGFLPNHAYEVHNWLTEEECEVFTDFSFKNKTSVVQVNKRYTRLVFFNLFLKRGFLNKPTNGNPWSTWLTTCMVLGFFIFQTTRR